METLEGTTLKGLPLPYDMRTVEGDLGLRINAITTIKEANSRRDSSVRVSDAKAVLIFSVDILISTT